MRPSTRRRLSWPRQRSRRVRRPTTPVRPRPDPATPHRSRSEPDATASSPQPTDIEASETGPVATGPVDSESAGTDAPTTTVDPALNPDGVDPLPPLPDDVALPIVFVHGFAGSAQQYESQKMRFVANGYPADRIVAYEHDGAGMDIAGYAAGTVATIDEALAEFGVEQVYLVGHSRGTFVSDSVLADPAQAAKVAKYVAIDGRPCPADEPSAVPGPEPGGAARPGARRDRDVEGIVRDAVRVPRRRIARRRRRSCRSGNRS